MIGVGGTVDEMREQASERPLPSDRGMGRVGGDVEQHAVVAVAAECGDVAHDLVVVGVDAVFGDLGGEDEVVVGEHVFIVRFGHHHVKR